MSATEKRYKKGPFEAYYNEWTESFHLVRYTGPIAGGKAYGCTRIGLYKTMEEAKDKMLTAIMEVLDELG